jgi:FkbM family methyltransferase
MYPKSTSCGEIGLMLHHILNDILGYKTDGVFVEIGANDGMTGSFTYNLSRLGWSGIYCEPVPSIYKMCKENHAFNEKVKCLNLAAGARVDKLEITEGHTLSTMDKDTLEVYKQTDWSRSCFSTHSTCMVDVEPLNSILETHTIKPNFDLLVLDVEGYEDEVLKGFDIEHYVPKIVIIEIADQHPDFIQNKKLMDKFSKLREFFKHHGYSFVVNDIVDNVYVRNDLYNENNYSSMVNFKQYC